MSNLAARSARGLSRPLARFAHASFAHAEGPPLIRDLDLDVEPGVLAVVGENGAGKSTLLALLDGTLKPTSGHVELRDGVVVARTAQGVDAKPSPGDIARVDDDRELSSRLGLDVAILERWDVASPGERRRWQLAIALASCADLLLLDEPTNHLDVDVREAVIALIRRRARRATVLVTHDRVLVDELATRTLRLHRGRALVVEGGWTESHEAFEVDARSRRDALEQARGEVESARHALGDARRRNAAAEKQRSKATRMKSAKDHDASGMMAQYRADTASKSLARATGRLRSRLTHAQQRLDAVAEVDKEVGRDLFVDYVPLDRARLCVVDVETPRGSRPRALPIARDARIRITGANGAGKTTLLRAIEQVARGSRDDVGERVFMLPQDLTSAEEREALEQWRALPREERGRAGVLLAALGVDPARLASSSMSFTPSSGEAKKLMLANALACRACALLLDEPTNHLDLPSVVRLERAIAQFPGAVVLVTHDDAFAQEVGVRDLVELS